MRILKYGKYWMTTPWTFPTIVEQYAEDVSHVGWNEDDGFSSLKTETASGVPALAPLFHIARSPKFDIKNKTWYLKCTGFNFTNLPTSLSGVLLRLSMHRGGRVTDETISLCYQNNNIGKNLADLPLNPITIYGGSTDTWQVENLDISMIQDSSFGIVLRFQSHPYWPHKTVPIINGVELQIS
jgi:hypothetical protein